MKARIGTVAVLSIAMTLTMASIAWAHTTVSPEEVSAGSTETFTVSTPGEKSVPIIEERVVVPQGFEVMGVSSPDGWQGSIEGSSVVWTGGEIPEGEEQQFSFEAQVPGQTGEYQWRAFDTYEDGSVSEWTGPEDSESPASVTEVVAGGEQGAAAAEGSHGHSHGVGMHDDDLPETGGVSPLVYGIGALGLISLGMGVYKLRRN
jgi:uncharacterized protein YcnI